MKYVDGDGNQDTQRRKRRDTNMERKKVIQGYWAEL